MRKKGVERKKTTQETTPGLVTPSSAKCFDSVEGVLAIAGLGQMALGRWAGSDWTPGATNLPFGPWLSLAAVELLLLGPNISHWLPRSLAAPSGLD